MTSNPPEHLGKILFIFSDTGGGHRSAAEAIIEAIQGLYGGRVDTEMVDIFRDYAPRPLNRIPDFYPEMVRIPELWKLGFQLSDGRRRVKLINASIWPYARKRIRSLLRQHPSNLIVSVHPLANTPVLQALGDLRPPFTTVVTDLVSAHMFWYDRRADLCIVPTREAANRARKAHVAEDKLRVVGLPVARRFTQNTNERSEIRERLGWRQDLPVVLLVGGGEGMGPLENVTRLLAEARIPLSLAVITGRNEQLKARLEAKKWRVPVYVYGFVREMPDFMAAADILLTKAGPGTISEALIAGLPLVLYSRLPGQEDGNISYVTDHGAGVWAPKSEEILAAVKNWLENPDKLKQARQACLRLARPQAADNIAAMLVDQMTKRTAEHRSEMETKL